MEDRFCSCGPLSVIPIYRRHPISLFLKGSCYFNETKGFAVLEHSFLPFWAFFARLFAPRYNARIQFLIAQTRILRSRIDASRIVPTPEEKAELLRWGTSFDHKIDGVMEVVKPETYRKWLRQMKKRIPFMRSGRPRVPECVRKIVCRMARANLLWGYERIVGELRKIGCRIGRTSVQRILKDEGIHPLPGKARKKPPIEWTTFVHSHMATLIACDFFTKPVYTLRGKLHAYVLVFIHLGSRKTFCSPPTFSPDGDWVMQQTRNAAMWLDEIGVEPRHLIHDRDAKFPRRFTEFWKTEGVRCIRIPPRAPMANCFAENFIGKLKKECLDHFVCFSLGHLQHIVAKWISYYNSRRPHQGFDINNQVLDKDFEVQTVGEVRCKEELGGIIKSYYRKAA